MILSLPRHKTQSCLYIPVTRPQESFIILRFTISPNMSCYLMHYVYRNRVKSEKKGRTLRSDGSLAKVDQIPADDHSLAISETFRAWKTYASLCQIV